MLRIKAPSISRRIVVVLSLCLLLTYPIGVFGHPMGNFTINHYSGIHVENGWIEIRYFIDRAEIPTFQELQRSGLTARLDDPKLPEYLSSQAQAFLGGLQTAVNGTPLKLRLVSQDVIFPIGAGNLPTMKLGFIYRSELSEDCQTKPCQLSYEDTNFRDQAGWKEVVVVPGAGVSLSGSTVPARDKSTELSNYPTDLINSPPQQVKAQANFSFTNSHGSAAGGPSPIPNRNAPRNVTHENSGARQGVGQQRDSGGAEVKLTPNRQGTPRNSFTELIGTQEVSLGIALLAALISAGLGALHALEPGHGKTIVAAYLVGSRGTAKHALLLGMIVTSAHTAGVYLLGAVTIYAQKYILPERIYPYLGVLSGALIAGMGCYLLLQRYLGADFSHKHDYSDVANRELSIDIARRGSGKVSARQLVVLGVTGGIVPCPAALVVLLSATALHRTVFGLYLILAFSLGLAAVLIAMGMITVYARRLMSRMHLEGPLVQKWLPMGSAVMITFLGLGIALKSLATAGLLHIRIMG
jgi:ABC-type nickel/cobalt efflux system permease component RcnA